jgi:hypothetical protein
MSTEPSREVGHSARIVAEPTHNRIACLALSEGKAATARGVRGRSLPPRSGRNTVLQPSTAQAISYARAFKPLRSTRSRSFNAGPLGVLSPISHFWTVETLVLR